MALIDFLLEILGYKLTRVATYQDVVKVGGSYAKNKGEPVKGYAPFPTTFAYNLPYGVGGAYSHGREYYSVAILHF